MRCPKCHYISFDNGDRCRNCGYEFSLSVDVKSLDLPIQTGDEPLGPLEDLSLSDLDRTPPPTSAGGGSGGSSQGAAAPPETPAVSPSRNTDLPLFRERPAASDAPRVTPPAVPRPPLAVRRSSPVIPRAQARPQVEEPRLELGPVEHARVEDAPPVEADREDALIAAPLVRRVAAGVIDVVIIGAIDLAVLYFTLKLCGLEPAEALIVPAVPFLAFLVLLNGGYFVAFTAASGQTIGKMAAGLKVVPSDDTEGGAGRVPLGHAVVRTAGYVVSVLPAGLGMLPALFSADGRALHDRLAGTRVILVS